MIAALALAAALPSVATMREHRRVLIVAAPSEHDPMLARARRLLAPWRAGADDRAVTVGEVAGDRVGGASDAAVALRGRYHLPPDRFAVLLIGKDGHVAERAREPLPPAALERLIDAMPMRRAGLR